MFDPSRPDRALLATLPFSGAWLALERPPGATDDVTSRLAMYRLLVERGNARGAFGAGDEMSPWWGYASQLAWQHASGRLGLGAQIAPDSWWGACNYALSVVPYVAAAQVGLVPPLAHEIDAIYAPALAAWRGTLELADVAPRGADLDTIRVAFWRAHVLSIDLAVARHRAELATLPAAEQRFARGWIRMVDLFGAAAVRTDLSRLANPGGVAELPSRVLGDNTALEQGEARVVRRVYALADRPRWRWALEVAAWRRIMRHRAAREESETLLAGMLGKSRAARAIRLRALRYAFT
jgi:hypothetical protein